MSVDNAAPDHGATITVTYEVTGNVAIPPEGATIRGGVIVGGEPFELSASMVKPGTPAATEEFQLPTCEGLTFAATGDPHIWTAVVP